MFGSHLSVAGSMTNALREAKSLGLDCVQVFTKNQQQWTAPPLKNEAVSEWMNELRAMGWDDPAGPARITSHASYLANMGSPDDTLREKSIALMREEVERCERLAIPVLVFHPGAATGSDPAVALRRIAEAVGGILKATGGYRTVMCFENVAGAGSHIGRTFEELAELRRIAIDTGGGQSQRVGFCIDTCHAHAAGYDLSTEPLSREAVEKAVATLGAGTIRSMHLNDSKGPAGSRLDRHAHIGEGTIGAAGFRAWITHPELVNVPKIMETPKGNKPDGTAFDTINVTRLRDVFAGKTPAIEPIEPAGKPKPAAKPKATAAKVANAPTVKPTKKAAAAKGKRAATKPSGKRSAKGSTTKR